MSRLLAIILVQCCCLTASGQLTASFSADKSVGCGPLVVHFTNQTSGVSASATWQWNLGNGNSSALANPVATFTQPGSYTVVLTVQDGSQTATSSQIITVDQPPTAAFSVPVTKVCSPAPMAFNSLSTPGTGAIASYLWDFGDGITQTVQSASTVHAYLPPGVYGVSLTVADIYGCVATAVQPNVVTVLPPLLISFTTNPPVLCTVNSPVAFTNNTTGPGMLSYQWNFGDGNSSTVTNPSYTYSVKGTYTVILTATSSVGCAAADTQTNVLNVANFQTGFSVPNLVCQGVTTIFNDSSSPTPANSNWVVDGAVAAGIAGPKLSYSFTTAGSHTVMLTNTYGGCKQSSTRTVTVSPTPVIPPFDMVEQTPCGAPVTVKFLDHTPGAVRWAWLFNDLGYYPNQDTVFGGPANSTQYGANGPYDISLTVTNAAGCSASTLQELMIQPAYYWVYETDGGPDYSCATPLTKSYAIEKPGHLLSYTWNFGDGTTSNSPTPTHTFSAPGTYLVTFTWTDVNGCTGSYTFPPIFISAPLNVDFKAENTTICPGQPEVIDAINWPLLPNEEEPIATYDFGDGTLDYANQHTYSTPGIYTLTMKLTNYAGCQQTVTKTNYITVLPAPTITLSDQQTCDSPRANVIFTVAAGNGATGIQWEFGDGTTQNTGPDITTLLHTFTETGGFVSVAVATNGTCSTSTGVGVGIWLKPLTFTLNLPVTAICPNASLYEEIQALEPPGGELNSCGGCTIQWFYGDGTPFQGTNMAANFNPNSAYYNSSLTGFKAGESGLWAITTNMQGCKDTTNVAPLVIGGVTAAYQIIQDDQCYQQPVILQDMSSAPPGDPIVSWLWNFGDGTTSTQSGTVQHLYASPGNYTVMLTVTDQNGCGSSSQSTVNQVTVNGPEAIFQAQGGAQIFPEGTTVQFFNNSNTANTTNPVYTWNFGDMTGSAQVNPAHLYALPGVYTVTLTAQDGASGCASTMSLVITIQPVNNAFAKTASYVASGSCPPVLVQFTNTSVNYISYTWDFGDGETVSNVPDPSHVYQNPGDYTVTLTVLEANGQTTTTVDSVVVVRPGATLSATTAAICQGQSVTLGSTGNQRVKGYQWDFGDGTVVSDADSTVSHVYATAGIYQAKLVVSDSVGCSVAATATDPIDVHAPPIVGVTPPVALACLGKGVTIKAIGGVSFSWSPGASLSDSLMSAPVAAPLVNTVYTVTVADDIGCTSVDSIAVRVVRRDTLQVSPDSAAICPGKDVQLQATGAYQYQWIGVVDGLSGTSIPNPIARPLLSAVYRVAGSDSAGCFADTLAVPVNVLEQPTVSAGPDLVVEGETPVTIPAVGSPDVQSWLWTPAVFLSCTDCAQPVCTAGQTEQYIVTVTAADGCTASDTVVVKLLCDEARVRIPDAFTPNGDGHNDRFTILGAISVVNHLVIFDRWGVKVFEADHFYPADPHSGWDGTMGGRPEPPGVYVYYAEMQCPTGGVFTRKGTVVLVR